MMRLKWIPFVLSNCLFASLLFISCGEQDRVQQAGTPAGTPTDTLVVVNDPRSNLNIQTSSFSEIDSSGVLMFPLSMKESKRSGSELLYKETSGGNCWNIVFLDTKTNAYHLLSDRKMLISSYDYKYGSGEVDVTQAKDYIFYSIITDDYNKDRLLTTADPSYLFVTDRAGKAFRQVSPTGADVQSWQFVKASGQLIMTVKKDTDRNKRFEYKDEITAFAIDLKSTAPAVEVFSTDFKNKLKVLYDRDWKRLE